LAVLKTEGNLLIMSTSFLQNLDITTSIFVNPPLSKLMEDSVKNQQARISKYGALIVNTGNHTGRSAKDKYIVENNSSKDIWWDNNLNKMSKENFLKLKALAINHLNNSELLYVTERSVGAIKEYNLGCNLITSTPQHALFSKYLFRDKQHEFEFEKDFLIIHAPDLQIPVNTVGNHSTAIISTCFESKTTIITGSFYAGEIKKSMFCVLNYQLPTKNVLPMHAGASHSENKDVSIFFGLSGTGKTTLSTDKGTSLIGDDEHGLCEDGVFNFEGGCYAKTYKLGKGSEPQIFKAASSFGAILENVIITEKTGEPDYFDKSITENGRCSYPLSYIDDIAPKSTGKTPKNMFFLTADAFGVLPPVSKLTVTQAMFYFVLGYTAKLAGTEIGVKEPTATFSCCFGGPFMLRHPSEYATLLKSYIEKHKINVYLINTGWTGGPFGVGQRFPLNITRQIIRTIQNGSLRNAPFENDKIFGLSVPLAVHSVPTSFLMPEKNWPSPEEYTTKARELAHEFHKQMERFPDFYKSNIEGSPLVGRKKND